MVIHDWLIGIIVVTKVLMTCLRTKKWLTKMEKKWY
jgi:hypothetical protein